MAKIPIHIITGFLGSGKTTFLQEFLQQQGSEHIALIVNELGEVALDHKLIETQFIEEQTLVLNAGCMCCNKREDLRTKCKELLDNYDKEGKKLERILIETTGLANPAPIAFTLLSDAFLSNHFMLANIITCVDALDGLNHINNNDEAYNQIISSDCILLTKTDLQSDTKPLKDKIHSIHAGIHIINKLDFNHASLFTLKHTLAQDPTHAKDTLSPSSASSPHTSRICSLSLHFTEPLDWSVFGVWLSMLLHRYGDRILRVKGLLNVGEQYLVNINGVGHIIYPPTHTHITNITTQYTPQESDTQDTHLATPPPHSTTSSPYNPSSIAPSSVMPLPTSTDTPPPSTLVFITKDLDAKHIKHSLHTFLKLNY